MEKCGKVSSTMPNEDEMSRDLHGFGISLCSTFLVYTLARRWSTPRPTRKSLSGAYGDAKDRSAAN